MGFINQLMTKKPQVVYKLGILPWLTTHIIYWNPVAGEGGYYEVVLIPVHLFIHLTFHGEDEKHAISKIQKDLNCHPC